MRKYCNVCNKSGISLVTMIITIVVIIILAGIVMYSGLRTPDMAVAAKYVQEFEEVRKGVESKRLVNAEDGIEYVDRGFSKVKVTGDIPYNFMSVDENEKVAYLVNLNYIEYDTLTVGQAYKKFESEGVDDIKTVTFGKDDVFVYDSSGRLFYAKGFRGDGKIYYEELPDVEGVKIVKIDQVFNPSKTIVNVIVTVESENEMDSVKVGDKVATKVPDEENKYQVEGIDKNGKYEVVAKDKDGNEDKEKIEISGIGSTTGPTVSAIVTNGTGEGDTYKIFTKTAKIKIISDTAKSLYIGTTPDAPTSWLAFSNNVERYFEESGLKTLYIWVKDDNGNTNEVPYVLKINVVAGSVIPIYSGESIESGNIKFEIEPDNDTYSKLKRVKIIFTEGRQGNGYQSLYRTNSGTGWSRWTTSYDNEATLEISKEGTRIEAKIVYTSAYNDKTLAEAQTVVNNIDTTPPRITSLSQDGVGFIKGTATDTGSKLGSYIITTEYIDFTNEQKINQYTWTSFTGDGSAIENGTARVEITEDGKYYFYVRDNADNISQRSINAQAPDKEKPVIDSVTTITTANRIVIKTVAHDNIGITGHAISRSGENVLPTTWKEISETKIAVFDYSNITEEGDYWIWVRDNAGNTNVKYIRVVMLQTPQLNGNYPEDKYAKEGETVEYEVVISINGYPTNYEFEWQVSEDGGNTWTKINGANTSTYSFEAQIEDSGNLYKCVITNTAGRIESNVAKLEVARITDAAPDVEIVEDKEMVLGGLIINNGDLETNIPTVNLRVVAVNAYEVNISEDGEMSDTWVTYKDSISYTIKDLTTGTKNISVWIRDSEGNVLEKMVSAQITLK